MANMARDVHPRHAVLGDSAVRNPGMPNGGERKRGTAVYVRRENHEANHLLVVKGQHKCCLRCGRVGKAAAQTQAQTRLWRQPCTPLKRYAAYLDHRHVPCWGLKGWECSVCFRTSMALRTTDCAARRRATSLGETSSTVGRRGTKRHVGSWEPLSGPGPPPVVFDLTGNRCKLYRKTCSGA